MGNNQIEIAHIELIHNVHHAGVGGNEYAGVVLVFLIRSAYHINGIINKLVVSITNLFAQCFPVAQEQYPLGPAGIQQQFGKGKNLHRMSGYFIFWVG
ncbi:hypothetical protein [Endozoicomonas sp. Mp262]|uniref:hypothetical protein n=1 Tax=Endozoicomonas sp. Mp262 TaxID=2919499 RepID=UPI0021DA1D87